MLGSDTTVAVGDEILGETRQRARWLADAAASVGSHPPGLYGGRSAPCGRLRSARERQRRRLPRLSEEECDAYWRSGEPADKAGGYAVQGRAAVFIERIAGSYSGIMGLPLYETGELLRVDWVADRPRGTAGPGAGTTPLGCTDERRHSGQRQSRAKCAQHWSKTACSRRCFWNAPTVADSSATSTRGAFPVCCRACRPLSSTSALSAPPFCTPPTSCIRRSARTAILMSRSTKGAARTSSLS